MDALRGIGLVLRTPRLWGMATGPLFGAVLAYVVLGVAGGFVLLPRLAAWLGRLPGGGFWAGLGEIAAVVLYVLLFPFLFTLLGGVFFGLVFERLSKAVEEMARPGQAAPAVRLGFGTLTGDTLRRLLVNGSLGLGALVLGLFLGPLAPVAGVVATGIIGLLDYTSAAYLRRGVTLGPQAERILHKPDRASLSFGLVAGLLSLIPVVGVLCMPGLIAGGTLLALRREEGDRGSGGAR